ncbi:hypothetical protein S40285_09753, partial [Stachybotrys chlorohalonatus IBT 40285]
YRSVALL